MKHILLVSIALLCCQPLLWGQQPYPNAVAGPEGIYINCGNQIPRDFAYQVYRRASGAKTWEERALISAENQFDRFFNKVKEANAHNPVYEFPADSVKMAIWGIINQYGNCDSIPLYGMLPMYREALGVTWYDDTAEKGKQYEYKVVMLKANQKPAEQLVPAIKYPSARKADYLIQTKEYEAKDERVNIAYTIGDRQDMYAAKIFRSYYLQSDFAPLTESIGFIGNDDGSFEAIAADKTVLKKGIVLYYLQPYDVYGNPGHTSDTIRVTNLINTSETVLEGLKARGVENGIKLSWKFEKPEYLRSIDIYKSDEEKAEHDYLISVSPNDTCFIDEDVEPNIIYYYKVVINNAYGKSPQSVNVMGWLVGTKKASAPYDLKAEIGDGVVHLTWSKPDNDTKAYYILRSDADSVDLRQVGEVFVSESVLVTYTDSVDNINSTTLAYAVKSENSSFDISPPSDTVYVNPKRNINLSTPLNLNTTFLDGRIWVRWTTVDEVDNNVVGYRLERRVLSAAEITDSVQFLPIETGKILLNYYEDTEVKEGETYEYRVISQGLHGMESAPSISSTCHVPVIKPISIHSLQVHKTTGGYQLAWEKTGQENIAGYNVYRVQENEPPKLLTTLKTDQTSYFDPVNSDGTVYLYTITCVGENNVESDVVQWMGAN